MIKRTKQTILLTILVVMIGFETRWAAETFQNGQFFLFGAAIAFGIWWIVRLIMLAIETY